MTPPARRATHSPSELAQALASLNGRRGGNARRTDVAGITFDSKREAARYGELLLLQSAGKISDLQAKTPACDFDLLVNGVSVGKYRADYVYVEDGVRVVEDSKSGVVTAVYRLKKRLMFAIHGVVIRETK